jgi:hypothetical protein
MYMFFLELAIQTTPWKSKYCVHVITSCRLRRPKPCSDEVLTVGAKFANQPARMLQAVQFFIEKVDDTSIFTLH